MENWSAVKVVAILIVVFVFRGALSNIFGGVAESKGYERKFWVNLFMWTGMFSWILMMTLPNLTIISSVKKLAQSQEEIRKLGAEITKYQKSIDRTMKKREPARAASPTEAVTEPAVYQDMVSEEPTIADMIAWHDNPMDTTIEHHENEVAEEPSLLDYAVYMDVSEDSTEENMSTEDEHLVEEAIEVLQKLRPELLKIG